MDVERIEFDAEKCSLRILGRNRTESDKIKMGAFHSVDIDPGTTFTLEKDNNYDKASMDERIEEITAQIPKEHTIVLPMQEGIANICVVSSDATITVSRITRNIPKKKDYEKARDASISKFFNDIYVPLKRHLAKFEHRSVVVVGRFVTYSFRHSLSDNTRDAF
jgi:protein pelota